MRREIESQIVKRETASVIKERAAFTFTADEYITYPLSSRLEIAGKVLRKNVDLSFNDWGYLGVPKECLATLYKPDSNTTIEAKLAYYGPLWQNEHNENQLVIQRYPSVKFWWRTLENTVDEPGEYEVLGEVELYPRLYKWPEANSPHYEIEPRFQLGLDKLPADGEKAKLMLAIIDEVVCNLLPESS